MVYRRTGRDLNVNESAAINALESSEVDPLVYTNPELATQPAQLKLARDLLELRPHVGAKSKRTSKRDLAPLRIKLILT